MRREDIRLNLQDFFIRIILPVLTVIALFSASFFFVIIPAFRKKIIDDKKEMIRELTDTAWSILNEYRQREEQGILSGKEAREKAIERIKDLRYGDEQKDYFWVIDMKPAMIVHPYRPELNGKDLSNYSDLEHKKLFLEFVKAVREKGSGFVSYMWQWKDDPDRIVPKLSYVKGFKPWGWIIGTGIYMEDIRHEISKMQGRLTLISVLIILLVSALLFYATRSSLAIEKQRTTAEKELREARDKYQTLVEASCDGLVMILEGHLFHANGIMLEMLGYDEDEFKKLDAAELFDDGGKGTLSAMLEGGDFPGQFETLLIKKDGSKTDVVLSATKISMSGRDGLVVAVKDISGSRRLEKIRLEEERENIIAELQTSLLFFNQAVSSLAAKPLAVEMNTPVKELSKLMLKNNRSSVLVKTPTGEFVGIISDHDITGRITAADAGNDTPAFEIMSSPLISISEKAQVFEAINLMNEKGIRHLAVKNSSGRISGIISDRQLLQVQKYSSASLIRELEAAPSPDEIIEKTVRLPLIVKGLVDSGARAKNITRILTKVSDTITEKMINFAINELGQAPCRFAFMALGSEGREEETLITDQDNAIVFEDIEDPEKTEEARKYFLELGRKVCGLLNLSGYSYCKGEIMAQNEKWCRPLSDWKKYFAGWINSARAEDLLEINIFFDFKCVYGDTSFSSELKNCINTELKNNPPFFLHMAQNCLLYKPPVGTFGSISVKSSGEHARTFSIKEAIKPIINFARLYSLKNGNGLTNTMDRINSLFERELISESTHREMTEVYDYLMQLRFKHQSGAISLNRKPDNYINPADLSTIEKETLKKVFSQISAFQSKISYDFKGTA